MLKNSEIRLNLAVLSFMMLLLLVYQLILMNVFSERLRSDYVDSFGMIAARLTEKFPDSEAVIMDTIMGNPEPAPETAFRGKELLRQYGLTEDLDTKLFPVLNRLLADHALALFSGLVAGALLLLGFSYAQYRHFFHQIRGVTRAAKKIVEGDYSVTISEEREGDLSKLAEAFRSMRDIIRQKMDDLQEEKRFLVHILQDISHQLKTPLSTITVYNDMLLNEPLSDGRRQWVTVSQSQVTRMNHLIQNLLKVAKIDAKSISFKREKLNLADTVEEALDQLQAKLTEKQIKLDFKPEREIMLVHDPLWIQEALTNIVKNAIEHSNWNGTIVIQARDTPMYAELTIRDDGEGIEEKDLPHIFKRFYKASHSRKDSTGIGLALAKSIIEAHDGLIKVESKRGSYTQFTITFMKY
ncbi:HAMP domain-containing histidine kinase [Paenibacillus pasadenensis]|uniref:HAMP domain-containing sensor histidine kinase n=1 Tax=Paenibacillus pasadenensis TaxID=217090 RepID=UPI00203E1CF6|nr:HAMP domain-containing sensor histidine kinase [Paenibacillus pasadenensis]MCM3748578.1 HAMP domain-containing histidine kinase [Paenibacillus pasadenensis]